MTKRREIAYRLDPALWVRDMLGVQPERWQEQFLRAPRGASLLALTARQVGKTTTASWAIGHHMKFYPNSLSVVTCPAQRQSAEAVRRVRDIVLGAKQELRTDNTYGLELENGSRVLALPGDDDSIRGLTVDGWIIIDEAARVSRKLVAAVRPMRARHPEARLAMMSTAWSRIDPFWSAWSSENSGWTKLKVTVDMPDCPLRVEHIEQERANLSEEEFKREYLGIPVGSHTSPFTWELYDRATEIPQGPARKSLSTGKRGGGSHCKSLHQHQHMRCIMVFNPEDPTTWPCFRPLIIAHDVARSSDRSTAVIGGLSPFRPSLIGVAHGDELPQGLYGHALDNRLVSIDRTFQSNALIVADISRDDSYAEILYQAFGRRVIGLQITRSGDGSETQWRPVQNGAMLVCTIGRTYLFDLLLAQLQANRVRLSQDPDIRRGYDQLTKLEVEYRQSGKIYTCPPDQHDDLAISLAMLVWAAQHPKLSSWVEFTRPRPRRPSPPKYSDLAWT